MSASKSLSTMRPRELLMVLTRTAQLYNAAVAVAPPRKKHGARGQKRRAKRLRARRLEQRLQRNTWRSYYEEEKRRAKARAES